MERPTADQIKKLFDCFDRAMFTGPDDLGYYSAVVAIGDGEGEEIIYIATASYPDAFETFERLVASFSMGFGPRGLGTCDEHACLGFAVEASFTLIQDGVAWMARTYLYEDAHLATDVGQETYAFGNTPWEAITQLALNQVVS